MLHELATCVPGAFASDTFGVVAEACAEALESTSGAHIAAAGAGLRARRRERRGGLRAARRRVAVRGNRRAVLRRRRRVGKKRGGAPLPDAGAAARGGPTRDAYYKTAAEALMACEALVPAFAAAIGSPDASVEDGAF